MIGDVLTTSILFEALRGEYPEAELHYLIYPHTRAVVENNPFIDQIIEYKPLIEKNPVKFFNFLREIKQGGYTIIIDVYSKISTGLIAFSSGASIRIGYQKSYTKPFYSTTFNYKNIATTHAGLAIENRMLLLNPLKSNFPKEIKPRIFLPAENLVQGRRRLESSGISFEHPLIMFGILGSSERKSYPLKYMASLLDTIAIQLKNVQILFNYLPSQKQEALQVFNYCSSFTRSRIFINIYEESLEDFILNCAACDLFIGNEGGAANIAKALCIPTFSIYSPSIKKKYWAIYEDGKQNKSIHLEELRQDLFKNKSKKIILSQRKQLYTKFIPGYILPELKKFLDLNGF